MHDPDLNGRPPVGKDTEPDLTQSAEPRKERLLELLVQWEEAHARGEELTPEILCGDDTRWLAALRERIAKRKRLHAVLAMPEATVVGRSDGPSPLPEPLPAFPGHEVLGEVGRGGMGVVYRALDVRLGRIVALKTLAEASHATRDQLDRFLDEAKAVARLRHPNIIAIHAIDEHEQRPYFSLEYAEGGNLAQWLANGPLSPRQAAELVESLAHAVHAAHCAGIVHRDLKPSNVLLTAEGVPKVSDFGLAKLLDGDSARTYSGQVMGTPSYMAPEQAEGRSREVGPAADVYALGAILYQALTGRPPFLGDSALETLKLVTTTEVVPPARLRPDVPRDLETICLKCLEKAASKRYVDARSLAEDLRRFQENRPIVARPVGVAGRLWRWAGRNRMLAAATAVVVAMFALGTPGFFVLWRGAVADRAAAVSAQPGRRGPGRRPDRTPTGRCRAQRAERTRDRASSAVRTLLMTEWDDMLAEELRPYRKALTDQGVREAQALVRELEGDSQAESQRVYGYLALANAQLEAGEAATAGESGRKAVWNWPRPWLPAILPSLPGTFWERSTIGSPTWRKAQNCVGPTPGGRTRSSKHWPPCNRISRAPIPTPSRSTTTTSVTIIIGNTGSTRPSPPSTRACGSARSRSVGAIGARRSSSIWPGSSSISPEPSGTPVASTRRSTRGSEPSWSTERSSTGRLATTRVPSSCTCLTRNSAPRIGS